LISSSIAKLDVTIETHVRANISSFITSFSAADELYKRIKKYRDTYHKKEKVPSYSLNIAARKNAKNVVMILLAMKASPFLRYRAHQALPIHLVCLHTWNPEIFKLLFWSMQEPDMNGKRFEPGDRCRMLDSIKSDSGWLFFYNLECREKFREMQAFLGRGFSS
jgi:hypothetical protein